MSNPPNPPYPPNPPSDPRVPHRPYWEQPIPYGTPQSNYSYRATSSAARTAGVIQIVLGSLATLLSFCFLAGLAMVQSSMLTPEQQAEFDRIGVELNGTMKTVFFVLGICMAIPSIAYIVLGAFVWRGSKVAVIISLVLTGLLILLNLIGLANSVLTGAVGLEGLCPSVGILGMLGVMAALLVWAWRDLQRLKQQVIPGWPGGYEGQVYPGHPGTPPPPPPPPQGPEDLPPPPVPPA